MTGDWYAYLAVAVIAATSLGLIVSNRWQWSVGALVVQYAMVFILTLASLSTGLALVKLLIGSVAAALLFANQPKLDHGGEPVEGTSGLYFRILAAVLLWVLVIAISPSLADWIPASLPILAGGLLLIVMGVLQIGMTTGVLRIILGLLTFLSGFEVLYAAIEPSALVAALLAGVTLALALVGVYLITLSEQENQ
jgi:hypothetical protein